MRTVVAWIALVGLTGALGAGCASHDGGADTSSPREQSGSSRGPTLAACGSRIDARITAGEIPQADREYFIGMCVLNR